jgi:uncharacterized membrane protein
MNLDKRSWFVQLFFVALRIWLKFKNPRYETVDQYLKRTNLCHFMRTIFVSAPLVILAHLALLGFGFYTLGYGPHSMIGDLWYKILMSALIGAAIVATILVVGCRIENFFERKRKTKGKASDPKMIAPPEPNLPPRKVKPVSGPSFGEVFVAWCKARKAAICPQITFSERGR